MEKIKQLYQLLNKLDYYDHALGLLYFDFETLCPKEGLEKESETINYLSNLYFKIISSKKYKQLIFDLYQEKDSLDPLDKRLIEVSYRELLKTKNITPKMQAYYDKISNQAFMDWLKSKEEKNYELFLPSFAKFIEVKKEQISLRDERLDNDYDNYLNDCEPGLLQADLDPFFEELKLGLIDLLNRIKASKKVIRTDFLTRMVPIHKQEAFSKYLLNLNGFDFARGAYATTEHPFTSDIAKDDVRVTTHYYENLFVSNIYSIVHEGGHAIFMQNEPLEDFDHHINDLISNGMHESVSRFYENIIGRSKEYIHLIYPKFQEIFKEEFADVSEQELYEAVNVVTPSLIRTEADEVTYCLHIIIRYEMEKAFFNGSLSAKDAKDVWNDLYFKYLGVKPANDAEGILQDVHWTGSFGYFPSYAIGNCYNAMYLKKIKNELDFDKLVETGDFNTINEWMKKNVFVEANHLDPKDWLKKLVGKELSPKDYLEYLNEKYSKIYDL